MQCIMSNVMLMSAASYLLLAPSTTPPQPGAPLLTPPRPRAESPPLTGNPRPLPLTILPRPLGALLVGSIPTRAASIFKLLTCR